MLNYYFKNVWFFTEKNCLVPKSRQCLLCPLEFAPVKLVQTAWFHLTCFILHDLGTILFFVSMIYLFFQIGCVKIGKTSFYNNQDSETVKQLVKEKENSNPHCLFCKSNYGKIKISFDFLKILKVFWKSVKRPSVKNTSMCYAPI